MRKLALFGVKGLPRGALRELADEAMSLASGLGKLGSERAAANAMRMLDAQAVNVAAVLKDTRDGAGRPLIEAEIYNEIVAVLAQHGVSLPNARI